MNRPRAFTLVEILVVVVILGTISAVLIPQLGTRDDVLVSAAARQVLSDLTFAQNRAITSQQPVYVQFTNGPVSSTQPGGSYSVLSALPSTVLTHPVHKAPWTASFGVATWGRVRLDSADFDGRSLLMFDESGAPHSVASTGGAPQPLTSGSVRVACNAFSLTVRVEPLTGTLSVQ